MAAGQKVSGQRGKARKNPRLFLFVPLFILAVVAFVPLFYALWISTHQIILTAPQLGQPFVGLQNFVRVLTEPRSLHAFLVTFELLVMSVGLELVLGVGLGVLMYNVFRSQAWLAVLLVLPMAIPKVVSGLVWNILYNPLVGVINYGLATIGLPKVNWLADPDIALFSIAFVDVWQWTPFIVLIVLAGLEAVPDDFYEAAELEGAGSISIFRYVTFPLLRPFLTVAVIFRGLEALRTFDYVFVLTKGGPGIATETVDIYAYHIGVTERGDISTATAAALLLLIVTIVVATVWVRIMRWGEEVY